MIANYHTHTRRCNHAFGAEREYIEQALAAGIKILGFSDHTPYPFSNGHRSGFRMPPEALSEYCGTLAKLREAYADRIELHIGLEAEYYPAHFRNLLTLCADQPVEYLLLGQHFTFNEYDGVYAGVPTGDERVLAQYCRQVIEALETGRFTYFAHPDLVGYTGGRRTYRKHMREVCRAARALEVPVEINLLGLAEGRSYPDPRFWELAGEEGLKAVIGCDAHRPEALNDPATERRGRAIAEKYGLEIVERLERFRKVNG